MRTAIHSMTRRSVVHDYMRTGIYHITMHVAIQDYVVMPEHLHFLIMVNRPIITKSGHAAHLGQVMAGFKKGCNKCYWEMIGDAGGKTAALSVPSGSPAGSKPEN